MIDADAWKLHPSCMQAISIAGKYAIPISSAIVFTYDTPRVEL